MKTSITELQAAIALVIAGFIGVLARLLSNGESMSFGQYIGRSVLNSFFSLAAFAVYLYFPDANPIAIIAIGLLLAGLGSPTFELIVQKYVKNNL